MAKHPMQNIVMVDGVARFTENEIVRFLRKTLRRDLLDLGQRQVELERVI